jgi:outer membrane protein
MKLKSVLFVFFFPLSLFAYHGGTQLRAGYFHPASHTVRDIYHGGIEGEIETSAALYQNLNLFANAGVFVKSGHSLGLHDSTRIKVFPLSLGLKYNFSLSRLWEFYLGAAPTYTWVRFHDRSPFVDQHVHKSAFGVVGKTGFIFTFFKRGFIDFFFDYYYTKISGAHSSGTSSTSSNIGGFRTGLGLGVKY